MIMVTDDTLNNAKENQIHKINTLYQPYEAKSKHIMGDYSKTPKEAEQELADKANMTDGANAVINVTVKSIPKAHQFSPNDKFVAYGDAIILKD